MSDAMEDAPEYAEFMAMLHKIEKRRKSKGLKQLQTAVAPNATAINQATKKIYLKKEINVAGTTFDVSRKECRKVIANLQMCLNNATAVQTALSNAAVQAQLQATVKQHVFTSPKLSQKSMSLLSNSHECASLQRKLAEVLASVERRRQAILKKRRQLVDLHGRVTALWKEMDKKSHIVNLEPDTDELKSLRDRVRVRESRIEIIAHFLQTLIVSAFPQWGLNREYVQVLRACELANTQQTQTLDQCRAIVDLLR